MFDGRGSVEHLPFEFGNKDFQVINKNQETMNGRKKAMELAVSGMAAVFLYVTLFSCSNEDLFDRDDLKKPCENICFGVSSGKDMQARGNVGQGDHEYISDRFVLRTENSADTLCVRAVVSDEIATSISANEKVLTRAAPIEDEGSFYDSFHVLAYWKKDDVSIEQFYMDEDVFKYENVWSSRNVYYWPGVSCSLKFYAWAPTGIDAKYLTYPFSSESTLLEYTVPNDVADQKDLMVANPSETAGDYNAVQSLKFAHICTAVRFEVGSEMQQGEIEELTLKGVCNSGAYDMATSTWVLNGSSGDFSQMLSNEAMTGTEANGTEITSVEGTFMMLPQVLPPSAEIQVVFSGREEPLTASIAGMEWKMGTTVTYKLSILPDYDLKFETSQHEIAVKDCHYVWEALRIGTDGRYTGKWAITTNQDWATLRLLPAYDEKNLDLYYQGYWCVNDRGTNLLTGESITTGGVDVLVYLYENTSDSDKDTREVTITLHAVNDNGDYIPVATRTISQYEPIWNGGKAYERIEEYDAETVFPWGFNWTHTSVRFTGSRSYLRGILFNLFKFFGYGSNIEMDLNGSSATIDMSNIDALGTKASDENNGLQNTIDLLNFDGLEDLNASISLLEGWSMVLDEGSVDVQPTNYAVRMILYKNKFNKRTQTSMGNTVNVAVLTSDGVEWYLPASGEVEILRGTAADDDETNNDTPLYMDECGYWSSRAEMNSNTNSYYYTFRGTVDYSEARSNQKRVRAARQMISH